MIVRAVVNPISGRHDTADLLDQLAVALSKRGLEIEIHETKQPGDATRLAREAPDDTHAVVAVGGDGTCREVADGLIGRNIPLVVAPAGTENIVAKYYGYKPDATALAETITNGRTMQCDVGVANDRHFLLLVGVGFDAQVVRELAAVRRGHITYWDYVRPTWRTFWKHRFPPLNVIVDGETFFEGQGMVFVGVVPRYAIGLHLLAHAQPDDGLLDVCIFPCRSRVQLLGHALRALFRRHVGRAGVRYKQCRTVQVQAVGADETIATQIDGDPAGTLPIECSVIPGGLRMLLPPDGKVRP